MESIKKLLDKYYDGLTTHEEEQILFNYFSSSDIPEELINHKREFDLLVDYKKKQLPESKTPVFENSSDNSIKQLRQWKNIARIAASVAFILMGYLTGNFYPVNNKTKLVNTLERDIEYLKENIAMLLLDQPLANERLMAVSYISKLNAPSDQIIISLLITLNQDPSENVRMATIPLLTKYYKKDDVVEKFIQSFNNQESPFVQIELLDVLTSLGAKKELSDLKNNAYKEDYHQVVFQKLESI